MSSEIAKRIAKRVHREMTHDETLSGVDAELTETRTVLSLLAPYLHGKANKTPLEECGDKKCNRVGKLLRQLEPKESL